MASRSTSSSIRRRSRRGNPDGLKKCILVLLDCFTSFAMTAFLIPYLVRNDGKGVVNYGSSIDENPMIMWHA
jgi:hypothetical protein